MGEAKRKAASGYIRKSVTNGWFEKPSPFTSALCQKLSDEAVKALTDDSIGADGLPAIATIDRIARATIIAMVASWDSTENQCVAHTKIMATLMQRAGFPNAGGVFGWAYWQLGPNPNDNSIYSDEIGAQSFHTWVALPTAGPTTIFIDPTTYTVRASAEAINAPCLPPVNVTWEPPPYLIWHNMTETNWQGMWSIGPALEAGAWVYCPHTNRKHRAYRFLTEKTPSLRNSLGLALTLLDGGTITTPKFPHGVSVADFDDVVGNKSIQQEIAA